ncbi:MAG: FtsX-like permease family protein, partial [Deltaproteobacteria bacterium]
LVQLKENSIMALRTIAANRFRAFLTVLGVFIGVFIIIAVASVLNGFRRSVVDQIEQFGTNNIYVYRFPFVQLGRLSPEIRRRRPLSLADARAIAEHAPSVRLVAVGLQVQRIVTARYRDAEMTGPQLRGVFPEAQFVSGSAPARGRFFSASENLLRAHVAVIGATVADALFPNLDPIGKTIEVDRHRYRVIGVLEKQKEGPFGAENPEDSVILVPYYTLVRFYPTLTDHFITAQAKPGKLDRAIEEITAILRARRNVRIEAENDFEIGTADSLVASFDQIVFATLAVMFMLSTVAFLVGGIGVMNIMLVSVTERTQEIGVRKAVGARRSDIVWQFLTEAAVLTGLGGLLGLAFGEGIAFLLDRFVPRISAQTPMWARIFGVSGSVAIGLLFGLWPAVKAARLDPIEALRHE